VKVDIGPHVGNRYVADFHYKYMNKKYGYDWEESTTRFEKLLEKLESWCQTVLDVTVNKLISKRKRKINVRIDSYDTWSMDHTLAYITLPMLKQLRDAKHGSPFVDKEDLPEHLRFSERESVVFDHGHYDKTLNATEEELEAVNEKFQSQWLWVIDQMIWSFEQKLDDDDGCVKSFYDPYAPDEVIEPRKYSVLKDDGNVIEKEESYWSEKRERERGKFNKEKFNAYHKRKQNGFILFGKYYQNLWD
jgi:hypothetical protein